MPFVPLEEIQLRIDTLQTAMAGQGIDAALIVQRADLYYYSGTGQDAHLLVPVEGAPQLFVRKSLERAVQESPLDAVVALPRLSDLRKVTEAALSRPLSTLGMELDVLPVNNYRVYADLFGDAEIVDVSPLVRAGRTIKSPFELDLMRQAASMNQEVYASVPHILKEGMSELEFSGLIEAEFRKRGHQGFVRVRSFNQEVFYGHVMSGANLAVPSCSVGPTGGPGPNPSFPQGAGQKIIRRNEPVQMDYVGVVDGYLVDQARTYCLGDPPEDLVAVHRLALAIQDRVAQEMVPGARCEGLYEIALDMATDAGQTRGFMGYPQPVPFIGHGVGLELDELPLIGKKSPHILEEGMVVAIEPKFIFPDKGLAGIENSFLITADGPEKLTLFDDEIQVVR